MRFLKTNCTLYFPMLTDKESEDDAEMRFLELFDGLDIDVYVNSSLIYDEDEDEEYH